MLAVTQAKVVSIPWSFLSLGERPSLCLKIKPCSAFSDDGQTIFLSVIEQKAKRNQSKIWHGHFIDGKDRLV